MKAKSQTWIITDISYSREDIKQKISENLGFSPEPIENGYKWNKEFDFGLTRREVNVKTEKRDEIDREAPIITETLYIDDRLKYLYWIASLFPIYSTILFLSLNKPILEYNVDKYFALKMLPFLISIPAWKLMDEISNPEKLKIGFRNKGIRISSESNFLYHFTLFSILFGLIGIVSFFTGNIIIKTGLLLVGVTLFFYRKKLSSSTGSWPTALLIIPLLTTHWIITPLLTFWLFGVTIGSFRNLYQDLLLLDWFATIGLLVSSGVILIIFVHFLFRTLYWCRNFIDYIDSIRLEEFDSPLFGRVVLFIYVIVNIMAFLGAIAAIDTLYYAVSGNSFLTSTFTSLWVLESMQNSFNILTHVFQVYPFFSSHTYSLLFYIVILSPVFAIPIMWMIHTISHIQDRLQIYTMIRNNSSKDWSSSILPENVEVIVTDDSVPNAHAGSLFFGTQDFIMISRSLVESDLFTDEMIEVILAHELYHLKNRDWHANLLATIFSLLLGGKNSLLTFHNYPQIEKQADDYAVEQFNSKTVIKTLENLDLLLQRELRGEGEPLTDLVRFQNQLGHKENNPDIDYKFKDYLTGLYNVFFGSILIEASHISLEERKQRIKENNQF